MRWLAIIATCFLLAVVSHAQDRPSLRSFYTTSSNSQIVHVTPESDGVRVRVIEFDYLDQQCWPRVVRAHEVVLPKTSVQDLAATPLCRLDERRVGAAIERAREPFIRARYDIPAGTPYQTVVAMCDDTPRRFVIDYDRKPNIDAAALRRRDRDVYGLWTLGDRIASRVASSAPDETERERLGTLAAQDLVSGQYDLAFRDQCWNERGARVRCSPPFWAQLLKSYAGPERSRMPQPELVEAARWQFSQYVAPAYPPIAMSARIAGDVRIRLMVDATSGAVGDAAIEAGPPLLSQSAIAAVRQWRFAPGTVDGNPFTVTLRYALDCH